MRRIAPYMSSMCVSCVCVRHEMAKTAGQIDMPFGICAQVGHSNHVLDGGPDPPRETGMLWHARGRYIQHHNAAFRQITSISC